MAQNSIAHQWNEVNLQAVRRNGARPTVIARTLYHQSIAMYDCWAVYDSIAETAFLGKSLGTVACPFTGVPTPADVDAARHEAISYASYRLLMHRYERPPGDELNIPMIQNFMLSLGYDLAVTGIDYASGDPAQLGNYIAAELISAGLQDGSNETFNYFNQYYQAVNAPLDMRESGNPDFVDLDRFQQLQLTAFWDQSCGQMFAFPQPFLSPEWGNVVPFALDNSMSDVFTDDRGTWRVYMDPGPPALLEDESGTGEHYKWGHEMVGVWSSHLDPNDTTMWDISPASIGNISLDSLPDDYADYPDFYNFIDGGDISPGHALNPHTGQPYEPQIKKRGDYARILAEFWADGPDSESPPGHWFKIYNEVSNYPEFSWKWAGQGEVLPRLEYDVKSYLTLGGAVHDAAIAAWSIKGYYDYVRPVAALRGMADVYGQCTDPNLPNFHPKGINLIPGYIEMIEANDPLLTDTTQFLIGEIKMLCWTGPGNEIPCEEGQDEGFPLQYPTELSGVDWQPVVDWWPYQRPTFVTPPFAGYISGHSTFSRAAAEVMTAITGDNFFPGGMGTFECPADSFLVFEEGPSEDITLQWATYQDASDQCSLSRIWGGIHPPCDDIPGRKIGYEVGWLAFDLANTIFDPVAPLVMSDVLSDALITDVDDGSMLTYTVTFNESMDTGTMPLVELSVMVPGVMIDNVSWLDEMTLQITLSIDDMQAEIGAVDIIVSGAEDFAGNALATPLVSPLFVDMANPTATLDNIMENDMPTPSITFDFSFDETMDQTAAPLISFPDADVLTNSLSLTAADWTDATHYFVTYELLDANEEFDNIDVRLEAALDSVGNAMAVLDAVDAFQIDTQEPMLMAAAPQDQVINIASTVVGDFVVDLTFSEEMDMTVVPSVDYSVAGILEEALLLQSATWSDATTLRLNYSAVDTDLEEADFDILIGQVADVAGNVTLTSTIPAGFAIDTREPMLLSTQAPAAVITDAIVSGGLFSIEWIFDEDIDATASTPIIELGGNEWETTLGSASFDWSTDQTLRAEYSLSDQGVTLTGVTPTLTGVVDMAGNPQDVGLADQTFTVDTRNPEVIMITANTYEVTNATHGVGSFAILLDFDEVMDTEITPQIIFPDEDPLAEALVLNAGLSFWLSDEMYEMRFDVLDVTVLMPDVDVEANAAADAVGNVQVVFAAQDFFDIDLDAALGLVDLGGLPINRVYPNPASKGEEVMIELGSEVNDIQTSILDLSGRVVYQNEELNTGETIRVPLNDLSEGMYLLLLESQGRRSLVKLQVGQ